MTPPSCSRSSRLRPGHRVAAPASSAARAAAGGRAPRRRRRQRRGRSLVPLAQGGTMRRTGRTMRCACTCRWADDGLPGPSWSRRARGRRRAEVGDVHGQGRERRTAFQGRARRHRLVAPEPVRQRPPPAHRLRAGRCRAASAEESVVEVDETTSRSTPTPSARYGVAREQTTRPSGSSHLPIGIVVQRQNQRSQASNKQTALRHP